MTTTTESARLSEDEQLQARLKESYVAVKKAVEEGRSPKEELRAACAILDEALADAELFAEKPKSAGFFYGDFVNGACKRLLVEGPIEDGEYMEVIRNVFSKIVGLLIRELERDNAELVDSTRVLFDPTMRLYKFQFLTPEESRRYQEQLVERRREEDVWRESLGVGDAVDCVKVDKRVNDMKCWDQGKVEIVRGDYFAITFVNDHSRFDRYLAKGSDEIAPAGAKADDYAWKHELRVGDNIDVVDPLGTWYNSTILSISDELEPGTASVPDKHYPVFLVGYRVYCDDGKKVDEDGRRFAGWSSKYDEKIAVTSPRIARYNSKTKYLGRGQSLYDKIDDAADPDTPPGAERVFVMPRKYYTQSGLYLQLFNRFGREGGFAKILARVRDPALPFELLYYFTEMMMRLTPMLHRTVAQELLPEFARAVQKALREASSPNLRAMEPERFDNLVPALEKMLTRVVAASEANLEVDLFNLEMCLTMLRSEFFPRRIQGFKNLNEVTKQLRFYVSRSFKADYLAQWLKKHQVLREVFSPERHHLQLIQRAGDVIKFLLLESELTPDELRLIWDATAFDEDVKMEVLKLVKEIAMHLPLPLCAEITDLIIASDSEQAGAAGVGGAVADKVMDELLDALYEIARFAMHKYDYTAKITLHLKHIAEDPATSPERATVALDRYAELLRVWPMDPDREGVLVQCVKDIGEHRQPLSAMKIVRNVLDNLLPHGKSEQDKYERAECIDFLVEQGLLDNFFADLEFYAAAVDKEIRENVGLYYQAEGGAGAGAGGKSKAVVSPNELRLFDRHPHSEHVKQRLDFLHYVLSQHAGLRIDKRQVQLLWEVLVVKSVVLADKEALFKWLRRACNEQTADTQFIALEDMRGFFAETMCAPHHKYKQLSPEGFECIKSYFLVVNESRQKLQRFADRPASRGSTVETSASASSGYTAISSDGYAAQKQYSFTRRMGGSGSGLVEHEEDDDAGDIEFKIRVEPKQLEGTHIFWNILRRASQKQVVELAADFLIKLHQQVDSTLEERAPAILQALIEDCLALMDLEGEGGDKGPLSEERETLLVRLVQLLKQLLLESEKTGGNGGVRPHAALLRGDLVRVQVNNSVLYKKEIPRKLELEVYANTTVWELRQRLSRVNHNISPEMVRLIKSPTREIKDADNAKTLAELRIGRGDTLIASKRQVQTLPKANLVTVGNELTAAASAIFAQWYESFKNEEAGMGPEGLANFTKSCTEDTCSPNDKRILAVFEQYDLDKDGLLNQAEFLEFYRESSIKRPKVVWNNILSHGYRRDLKPVAPPGAAEPAATAVDVSQLPRSSISNSPQQFGRVFALLGVPGKVGKEAWELVNQLTTNPALHASLLGILAQDSVRWEALIDASSSIYKLLYTLQIVESFLEEPKGAEKMVYIEEEKKKDKEGKEKKVEVRKPIRLPADGGPALFLPAADPAEPAAAAAEEERPALGEDEELKKQWRLKVVEKGGLRYLLQLFLESGEGKNVLRIKDDMDRIEKRCLGFVLRILKLYIIAAYCSQDASAYNMVFARQASLPEQPDEQKEKEEDKEKEKASVETGTGTDTEGGVSGFIGPLSQSQYNAMTDTYSITESLLFGEGAGEGGASKPVETKRKEMTSKEGRELVELVRGETAQALLAGIDFKHLQQRVLDAVILVLSKKSVELDDTKNIENALNLWLVCMLNRPALIQEFYDFHGTQVLTSTDAQTGHEVSETRALDCKGLIQAGLFCHKSSLVRQEFEQTLFYLATKLRTPHATTGQSPLSVVVGLLLQLMPEQHSQEVRECKEYFSLLCELLDLREDGDADGLDAAGLFELAVGRLLEHKSSEKRKSIFEDKALIGYLNLTNKLLASVPEPQALTRKYGLIEELFQRCLFAPHKQLPEGAELGGEGEGGAGESESVEDMTPHKCKTRESRAAAYSLLSTVVRQDPEGLASLVHTHLLPLTEKIKVRTGWAYTPASDSRSFHGYAGLRNLGCICYMLAMIQQFYMVPSFRYQLLRVEDGLPEEPVEYKKRVVDDNVLHQLQKMLGFMELTERQDFNPFDFCFACKDIEGNPTQLGVQQDAQEFLNVFFDRIETALRPTPQKYLLQSVFGGKNCNQCICQNCGNITRRVEDFYNLSLEVRHMKSVYDSLDKYVSGERIDDFSCEACRQKVSVVKRTCLSALPNVLIVHLQRITLDYDTWQNVKINSRLEFPAVLNLKPYMERELLRQDQQQQQEQQQQDDAEPAAAESAKESEEPDPSLDRQPSSGLERQPSVKAEEAAEKQKEKEKEAGAEEGEEEEDDTQFEFKLVGVVIHVGTAEAGHYYSYINTKRGQKNDEQSADYMLTEKEKWLEFNDSSVRDFKFSTLDAECFGGEAKPGEQSLESEIFSSWTLRNLGGGGGRDNCKNAYMLVYERRRKGAVKVVVPPAPAPSAPASEPAPAPAPAPESLAREGAADARAQPGGGLERHYDAAQDETFELQPFNSVGRFVPHRIYKQVWEDNNEFLFEKQIYANEFFSFLRDVLLAVKEQLAAPALPPALRAQLSQDMVSIGSKMVLEVLSRAYSNDPVSKISEVLLDIYQSSEPASRKFLADLLRDEGAPFSKLMFSCPDKVVRNCVSRLTATCLNTVFLAELDLLEQKEELFEAPAPEQEEGQQGRSLGVFPKALSVRFLDFMEGLVRSECHKHWTKFEQFFTIFRDFAMGGAPQRDFLMRRQAIAMLLDFMLANSSPLKQPHEKRSPMGSRYMVPYFDSIVETVCFLARHSFTDSFLPLPAGGDSATAPPPEQLEPSKAFLGDAPSESYVLSAQEVTCLRCPAFVEKSLKEAHAPKALASFIQHWAHNNQAFSYQVAKIILNGINETDYQEIVPYLSCISEFLSISDAFTSKRLEWLLGVSLPSTGRLPVELSRFGLTIVESPGDDVTNYYSPITFDNTNESVLTLLWRYHNRWDTYTMRCLNCLLWLMHESEAVFDWVFRAAPPTYQHARYSDWFEPFIKNYIADFKKYQSAYSSKREEMAQESLNIWLQLDLKIHDRLAQQAAAFREQAALPPPLLEPDSDAEADYLRAYPPNYILGETHSEKMLWKKSQDGIDIRIFEVFTTVYWSYPQQTGNAMLPENYFRAKKIRKEHERRVFFEGGAAKPAAAAGAGASPSAAPKPAQPTQLPDQKEPTDLEPVVGGELSDGNDSTAAHDGSDSELVPTSKQEPDTASLSSGENIAKITATAPAAGEAGAGPHVSVVAEERGAAAEVADKGEGVGDAEGEGLLVEDEKQFIRDEGWLASSVLKVTITNTRDKQAKVAMSFLAKKAEGGEAAPTPATNFYLPETPFQMKIKEGT